MRRHPWWALLSHYRRHPLQLLSLWLVAVAATALWSGVWALTEQARDGFERNERLLGHRHQVVRIDGRPPTVDDFGDLRRAGACVTPWLEAPSRSEGSLRVGVDPFTIGCVFEQGEGVRPGTGMFVDISRVGTASGERLRLLAPPEVSLPEGYRLQKLASAVNAGELSDSFLLNLNALSVLVLLIAALLVRSIYSLGVSQRQVSLDLLYRFGIGRRTLSRYVALELLILTLLGSLPGVLLGTQLAIFFSSGFGQAMTQLFDAGLWGERSMLGSFLVALPVMLLVFVIALADQLAPSLTVRGRRATPVIAVFALLSGLVATVASTSLFSLLLALLLVFAGIAVLTPPTLAALVGLYDRWRVDCDWLSTWQRRELGVLLRRLRLPVVALQFALATVIAIQALVVTFEATFQEWLAYRLSGDAYLSQPATLPPDRVDAWLSRSPLVSKHFRVRRGRAGVDGRPVDLLVLPGEAGLLSNWRFLEARPDVREHWRESGVLVNEQLARRQGLETGDRVSVSLAGAVLIAPVSGVYADYGRPAGEVLLSGNRVPEQWVAPQQSVTITLDESASVGALESGLRQRWPQARIALRDHATIHQLATRVFDSTFALTQAISALALALASVSLVLMMVVVLRTRMVYWFLLRVWGVGQRSRRRLLVRLSTQLTAMVGLSAIPVGVALTWVLVARINPLSFGWSLPMAIYPAYWIAVLTVALLIGLGVGFWFARHPATVSGEQGAEQ